MEKVSQSEILKYCIKQKIPFAIYRFPHTSDNVLVVSNMAKEANIENLFKLGEDIFTFAPFSIEQLNLIYFNVDYRISNEGLSQEEWNRIKQIASCPEQKIPDSFYAGYSDYKKQFEELYFNIKSGEISKAILSRIKHEERLDTSLAAKFYYRLSNAYPRAYTFMVYTPQTGLWTGASPELLFSVENGLGTTVSLAGTRKNNEHLDAKWDNKELDEQQIVSDFVTGVLSKYEIVDTQITGPETIIAGKMSHLKTTYNFSVNDIKDKLGEFLHDLHPTPAVCGLPKLESMSVINKVEKHDRNFYAGFLGRITKDDINLFVNIRSMKFIDKGVDLYLGGGITLGSEPEKEWQETELKAQTMLNVIEEVLVSK